MDKTMNRVQWPLGYIVSHSYHIIRVCIALCIETYFPLPLKRDGTINCLKATFPYWLHNNHIYMYTTPEYAIFSRVDSMINFTASSILP